MGLHLLEQQPPDLEEPAGSGLGAVLTRCRFSGETEREQSAATGGWLHKLKGLSGRRLYWATIVVQRVLTCTPLSRTRM